MQEGLTLFRALGNIFGVAYSLTVLASVMFVQGDLVRARALAEECLALAREAGIRGFEADALALLGEITLYQDDTTTARMLIEQSCTLWQEIGNEEKIVWTLSLLGQVIAVQGDHTTARTLYEKSLIRSRSKGVNSNIASLNIVPEGLAAVVAAQGEPTWAARLWGAAEALRDAMGTPIHHVYRADYEQAITAARAQLGQKAFAAAWAEGRTMTPEQVVAALESASIPEPGPSLSAPAVKPTYPHELTEREVEVLRLVAQGLTDAQIAGQLVISKHTASNHVKSILSKLGVTTRTAATHFAFEHKLV